MGQTNANRLEQLVVYRQKLAALESELAPDWAKLRALPSKLGFKDIQSLIEVLYLIEQTPPPYAAHRKSPATRKRAIITSEIKNRVGALVRSGKTNSEVAIELEISAASVQNIKKSLGLVKRRSRQ